MPHNIDSMAFHGDPPWHGLGVRVPEHISAEGMIRAAGLDWRVEMEPVPGARLDARGRPLKYSLVRKARIAQEKDVLLGLVSPRYTPLQNTEAFAFFDPIIQEKAATFETAGALGDGERVWVLAKLSGEMRVAGDDVVERYLLLSNTHDGKGAVTVRFTPIRVVCQNTLLLALEGGERSFRVVHTGDVVRRLAEGYEVLGISKKLFEMAERRFQALARISMNGERLTAYLEALFPPSDTQRQEKKTPPAWALVTELFERGDPQLPSEPKTLWRAYNAVVRYEDYRPAREAVPDRRLDRVWFGAGADLKLRALQQAEALAKANTWVN
jgi:phage/plasmid-like protein (TIGR03299 family)